MQKTSSLNMVSLKKLFFSAFLLGSLTSLINCTKDFEEINTNPNAPLQVQPELLLRQVIYDFGEQMSYEGFTAGNLLGQYTTALDFNLFDRHDLKSPQLGGNPWPILYQNLRDNEILLQQALESPSATVYEGPARILKAYMAAVLTDLYGDVPYSVAFQGKTLTVTPEYDSQESIYTGQDGILENLDLGLAAISAYNGSRALEGDILFNGDLEGWRRFGNSLKIKSLIRISAVADVAPALQDLYDEASFIMQNSQNATFDFTDGEPNNFRLARLRIGDFNNFVLSETMEEVLTGLQDPRLEILYRPFANSPDGSFSGLLNGIDASQTSIALADYSLTGTVFREESGRLDANFITAWETNFLLAEAAHKSLINADAQALYELAVAQAFEYWGAALPVGYLSGAASFNNPDSSPLQQIITQKWIGNTINGYEGWIEYRRTGFPLLKTISASLNNDLIPVRMPYPAEEEALNNSNYQEAFENTEGNSINVPVWWDVNL
ncbi:SusD/RagB family nutrient-binding outer membrane lipoprotein [Robiginitalea sp. IMCC43444]|uniref:SusD/RagB family nutrient-binding outer membrane lipoprotein n=1 Tax=Robiginitalea sp. IMCC43444 TaxID=3459121 RepID=UPI00404162F7